MYTHYGVTPMGARTANLIEPYVRECIMACIAFVQLVLTNHENQVCVVHVAQGYIMENYDMDLRP